MFFFFIYHLVMPKYWGKQIFTHRRFPEVGQKQKTEERERKKERLNNGNNNGQDTHGARKPPGPKSDKIRAEISSLVNFTTYF